MHVLQRAYSTCTPVNRDLWRRPQHALASLPPLLPGARLGRQRIARLQTHSLLVKRRTDFCTVAWGPSARAPDSHKSLHLTQLQVHPSRSQRTVAGGARQRCTRLASKNSNSRQNSSRRHATSEIHCGGVIYAALLSTQCFVYFRGSLPGLGFSGEAPRACGQTRPWDSCQPLVPTYLSLASCRARTNDGHHHMLQSTVSSAGGALQDTARPRAFAI